MARLSLDLGSYRPGAADALERALAGDREAAADGRVATLLPTATALRGLELAPGPDPDFVAALAARLAQEAESIAAAAPARPARPASRRTASSTPARRPVRDARPAAHPVVLVVGRTVPRLAAGLVASVLAVAAVVGFGAQGSLPGQSLYPVKQLVDAAQVQLAGTDLDRGTVQLAQAADHVQEARRLVADGARPAPADVDTALRLAAERTRDGRASLRAVPAADEGQALTTQGRFLDQVVPQLDALRGQVPSGSLASLTSLRTLVAGLATQVQGELAACNGCAPPLGQVLGAALGTGPGAGTVSAPPGSVTAGAGSAGSSGASPLAPVSGVSGVTGVTGSLPGGTALPAPGSTANLPSVGIGNSTLGGGVRVPGVGVSSTGASVGGGGVGATLPGVTATVGVPTVTLGSGGIGVGGGGIGLGGSTPKGTSSTPAPSLTVPLPGVTVGGGSAGATIGVGGIPVVSNTCVLGICPR